MNLKRLLRQFMLLLSLSTGYSFMAAAQEEPEPCGCQTNSINIGTGVDPATGTPLPPGTTPQNYDPNWVLIQSPDPSISVPAIPWIIPNGSGVWGSATPALHTSLVAAASYISPFNTQVYSINNPAPQPAFIFRLDFCVCASDQYTLTGLFNADDEAELWLDGTTLLQSCPNWNSVVNFSSSFFLTAGSHYLEIHLRNTGAQVMGVALSGNITSSSSSNSLIGYDCCNPRGGVNGRKYLDVNHNGVIDASDPIGAGWTFTLNPGGYTVTSDAFGYFNFPAIPPGVYTLSEVVQPGWNAVQPSGGSTTVNIGAGQIVTVDFLNTDCGGKGDGGDMQRASSKKIMELEQQVTSLKKEISELKGQLQSTGKNSLTVSPNPTNGQVTATFHIAAPYTSALIRITDNNGRTIMSNAISGNDGATSFVIPYSAAPGNLVCTLVVDGKPIATQQLILQAK